jgi:hypothetical protein
MLEVSGLELLQVIEQKGRQVDIMLAAGAALLYEERPHLAGVLLQMNKEIIMEGDHEERGDDKKTEQRDIEASIKRQQ